MLLNLRIWRLWDLGLEMGLSWLLFETVSISVRFWLEDAIGLLGQKLVVWESLYGWSVVLFCLFKLLSVIDWWISAWLLRRLKLLPGVRYLIALTLCCMCIEVVTWGTSPVRICSLTGCLNLIIFILSKEIRLGNNNFSKKKYSEMRARKAQYDE